MQRMGHSFGFALDLHCGYSGSCLINKGKSMHCEIPKSVEDRSVMIQHAMLTANYQEEEEYIFQ